MLAIGTRVKVNGVSESGEDINGIGTVTEAYYELGEDKTQDGRNTLPNMLYR